MKAIKCLKYGGSENLVLADVEKPMPKNNEVLKNSYPLINMYLTQSETQRPQYLKKKAKRR